MSSVWCGHHLSSRQALCGDELIVIMNYQLSDEDGEQGESTDSLQGQLHTPEQLCTLKNLSEYS